MSDLLTGTYFYSIPIARNQKNNVDIWSSDIKLREPLVKFVKGFFPKTILTRAEHHLPGDRHSDTFTPLPNSPLIDDFI
jgi:hypothetical protein